LYVYLFEARSPTLHVPCQGNFEVGLFQEAIGHDTNNTGQYRLGMQIGSWDRNRLCTTAETRQQNRGL
jgi:hypothetical protein